ncbi:hypothetical protein ACNI2I_20465 [Enterobacter hormaechei]|uniref:hypothetical protein n=1 Tax=Enterobacteriaceae TaxID=543 RepID=UPI0006D9A8A5|nr:MULTISPECIES: hypothetical protein [Enterobacteriaceae]EKV8997209.1 hypothetical protein [Enterobacter hormaechei]KPR17960.1 hypothetical protein AN666_15230 [Enterobacter hormaechei]MBW7732858.1 hypothetical protein [Enterobacter hormaechei]MDM3520584.1 hypothetical protein [Citrobacter sp. Ca225]
MAHPTNVVALIDTDFLANARQLLKSRDQSFTLYEWALKAIRGGQHTNEVEQLIGELINEVHGLNVQLHGRTEQKATA